MTTIPQIPSDTTTTKPHINPNPNPPQRPPDLPRLPIPPLKDTCARYLRALEALQSPKEHAKTKEVVREFLESGEGELWQEKLEEYAKDKESYIEEFWYESYLSHSDSVVLSLNPFFVLSSDVTPRTNPQLSRAAALITSTLFFIHDLRNGLLQPDAVRGIPLDMSQYERLFGTCRVPTDTGCRMEVYGNGRHIVVLRRGQFYWFDCLDSKNRPLLTDREILRNLDAIVKDADKLPTHEIAKDSVGILTTESRKIWSGLRSDLINSNKVNKSCLEVVESALFIVCLDDAEPEDMAELCSNFLCGGYKLEGGVQVGTCTNRWYDKLQIIVCSNGEAGINFEHTGVDGHTVLRYAADVYTELVLLYAKTINPSTPSLFQAKLSPFARSAKGPPPTPEDEIDTTPKKLEWKLTPDLRAGIRFAETRISDLICQNDSQALEFKGYGGTFIKRHGFSPDAFVQMAFQAAYYGLYGRVESTYEPAMTKSFLHGRTEAIRTVQPESVAFVKTFCSETATPQEKIAALHKACKRHVKLTKECSQGLGQDRHLYALHCLARKEVMAYEATHPTSTVSPRVALRRASLASSSTNSGDMPNGNVNGNGTGPLSPSKLHTPEIDLDRPTIPAIFKDSGYNLLGTSVLSTSNCGNPALRLFGFGPVTPEGYGIGYIIKDEGISVCMSSKHLQTRRLLHTLKAYLLEIQRILIQMWKEANERPVTSFIDHFGILRDARTGKPINMEVEEEEGKEVGEEVLGGFGFFDVGAQNQTPQSRRRKALVGKTLSIAEY
ncbi:carnitine O-acetyltransferase [Cryptococcus gattii E566]|uniref:Carnitine O-acetyltransferase, putative n=2 Tax=Cryptococcus gattii TaxID=37769 RepID=E6R7K2_CRYGW|nr:Carnitine O-acetyltransferase, putative [Cryptococcus gattii WM276]ADV22807.1 Carnitine O-acetyltransferase, putative [Cryptococcus gattii WM276]KIR82758.1 carnitine O-acetyltransferase [Cryptococcus gattii EJB2]KIY32353.1 carnitine O-acetyltransferase [Cryptococcus gattii E566]KJE04643.1 carnitine O-acetyltransferase [Cryptococcus gattii NT-10]